jgi:hypothetical protein
MTHFGGSYEALEPLQFAEDVEEEGGGEDGDAADPLGAVGGFLKGQALEVHAVDAGDGERWDGDGSRRRPGLIWCSCG